VYPLPSVSSKLNNASLADLASNYISITSAP
jgi:hypothetical protein